jgi:hypothetical protein
LIQTKIEKYEQLDRSSLNNDQLETISRKAEVHSSIKELEEIQKQLVLFEQDLLKEKQQQKEAQEIEIKTQVSQAIQNTLVLCFN